MSVGLLPLDAFIGLDMDTGRRIAGEAHLRQSVRDILTTPIGADVMNRGYGAGLFGRLDAPMQPGRTADIVADSADALARHEPRVTLQRVVVNRVAPGALDVDLRLERAGRELRLDRVRIGGAS